MTNIHQDDFTCINILNKLCSPNIPSKGCTSLNLEEPGKHIETKLTRVAFIIDYGMYTGLMSVSFHAKNQLDDIGGNLQLCFKSDLQGLSAVKDVITSDTECLVPQKNSLTLALNIGFSKSIA